MKNDTDNDLVEFFDYDDDSSFDFYGVTILEVLMAVAIGAILLTWWLL